MLEIIGEYGCTLTWVPNFAFQFLARRTRAEDRGTFDLSTLRAIINCSEPVRAASMDEFAGAFACTGFRRDALQSSYAMAENVFAVTQSCLNQEPVRRWIDIARLRDEHRAVSVDPGRPSALEVVSSGRCLPGSRVRVLAGDGSELEDGYVGEIAVAGDCLFSGYYNRHDLTENALKDGWYLSGDLGFVLDGELFVTGRKKDIIIVGGKNIYPQDVEEIAYGHSAVRDGRAVATGVWNERLGTEDIVVVVETQSEEQVQDADNIERAIRAAATAELGIGIRAVYVKPPKWIVKSTAGKPARSATRERLLEEHPELVELAGTEGTGR
jgi:acyl-CoA synthetase (AMP-forming)/AMP-acid ligase II